MSELTGLQKVRKACADAAGWDWCDEHRQGRCPLHDQQRDGWQDYDPMLRDESASDDDVQAAWDIDNEDRLLRGDFDLDARPKIHDKCHVPTTRGEGL